MSDDMRNDIDNVRHTPHATRLKYRTATCRRLHATCHMQCATCTCTWTCTCHSLYTLRIPLIASICRANLSRHSTLRQRRLLRRRRLLPSRYCTAPHAAHPPQREPRSTTPCTACLRFPCGWAGRSMQLSAISRHAPHATRNVPRMPCTVRSASIAHVHVQCVNDDHGVIARHQGHPSSQVPIANPNEWLEMCNAGAMGKGARFKKSGGPVILPVNGTRVVGDEAKAEEWRREDSAHRHTTACFVDDADPASSTRPVVVMNRAEKTGTLHALKDIWDQCDPTQCTRSGEQRTRGLSTADSLPCVDAYVPSTRHSLRPRFDQRV